MTEGQARAALAAIDAIGDLEVWIAEQPWEATPSCWRVLGELDGLRFRLEPAPGGVRVIASTDKGRPETWFVPA